MVIHICSILVVEIRVWRLPKIEKYNGIPRWEEMLCCKIALVTCFFFWRLLSYRKTLPSRQHRVQESVGWRLPLSLALVICRKLPDCMASAGPPEGIQGTLGAENATSGRFFMVKFLGFFHKLQWAPRCPKAWSDARFSTASALLTLRKRTKPTCTRPDQKALGWSSGGMQR